MRLHLTFYVLLFTSTLWAQKPFIVHGTPHFTEGVQMDSAVVFYEDKAREPLTLAQVQQLQTFRPYTEKRKEHITPSNVTVMRTWLKFKIQNTHPTDTARLVYYLGMHQAAYLYEDNKLIYKGGYIVLTENYKNSQNYLDFSVAPNSIHTYWLQIVNREFAIVPIEAVIGTPFTALQHYSDWNYKSQLLFVLLNIFMGCLFFMMIYAAYHFLLTKDVVFGYYALYVAFSLCAVWIGVEIRFQMSYFLSVFTLTNNDVFINDVKVSINLSALFYTLFIGKILDVPKYFPRIWQVLKVLIVLLICQQTLLLYQIYTGNYFYEMTYYKYRYIVLLVNFLLPLYAIIKSQSAIKGYLLVGISCLLCVTIPPAIVRVNAKLSFKHSPNPYSSVDVLADTTIFWVFLGMTLEALFFIFALAHRSYLIQKENSLMQQKHATELEKELAKRTEEVNEQNKKLEEQRIKQLESSFEQRLAETEMTALRAQMNPHFIFNCLNSIKLYTLENDSAMAADYLSKFSKLIRLVLENSRAEKITLQNELETVRLYMDMEAMRFKNKVKYTIDVAAAIDPQFVEIPPLLLQPYIENAIWHGLMHRENGGTIHIEVTQPNDDLLHVVITDNGIGRQAAADLKSKSATQQKSLGMKITTSRSESPSKSATTGS